MTSSDAPGSRSIRRANGVNRNAVPRVERVQRVEVAPAYTVDQRSVLGLVVFHVHTMRALFNGIDGICDMTDIAVQTALLDTTLKVHNKVRRRAVKSADDTLGQLGHNYPGTRRGPNGGCG